MKVYPSALEGFYHALLGEHGGLAVWTTHITYKDPNEAVRGQVTASLRYIGSLFELLDGFLVDEVVQDILYLLPDEEKEHK